MCLGMRFGDRIGGGGGIIFRLFLLFFFLFLFSISPFILLCGSIYLDIASSFGTHTEGKENEMTALDGGCLCV